MYLKLRNSMRERFAKDKRESESLSGWICRIGAEEDWLELLVGLRYVKMKNTLELSPSDLSLFDENWTDAMIGLRGKTNLGSKVGSAAAGRPGSGRRGHHPCRGAGGGAAPRRGVPGRRPARRPLHNVYRAFDYREGSTIYDVLACSVTGDLLQQTYLETKRGLILANQGGAQAKVKSIELISVEASNLPGGVGFTARCVWNVSGSVGHWGHIHQRQNQYGADLRVEAVDGVWRITALDLLQEERLK